MPRDWTRMTAADFDREAEPRDAAAGPDAAGPDPFGTPPLFGAAGDVGGEQQAADGR